MKVVGQHPRKVFFFCEEEATSGGETALLGSHVVYERMKEKHVEFVEKLEKVGLINTRIMEEEDDISSEIGRGWKSTFGATDRIVAQQRFLSSSSYKMSFIIYFTINFLKSYESCRPLNYLVKY